MWLGMRIPLIVLTLYTIYLTTQVSSVVYFFFFILLSLSSCQSHLFRPQDSRHSHDLRWSFANRMVIQLIITIIWSLFIHEIHRVHSYMPYCLATVGVVPSSHCRWLYTWLGLFPCVSNVTSKGWFANELQVVYMARFIFRLVFYRQLS